MSDLTECLAEMQSAETMQIADAEFTGLTLRENGMDEVTLRVEDLMQAVKHTAADTDEQATREEESAEDTPEDSDKAGEGTEKAETTENGGEDYEPSTWKVNGEEYGYNGLQKAVSEQIGHFPNDRDGDTLAKHLEEHTQTTENDENGGFEPAIDEMDYNTLRDLNSALNGEYEDFNYPEDQSTEGLRESLENTDNDMLKGVITGNTETEDTTEDTESTDNAAETTLSRQDLLDGNVQEDHVEAVMELRQENGECQCEGCLYATQEGEDFCVKHDKNSPPVVTKDLSDLTKGQKAKVLELMEKEGKSKQEAIRMA